MQKPFVIGDLIVVDFNEKDEPYWNYSTSVGKPFTKQNCKIVRAYKEHFEFEYTLLSGSVRTWTALNTNNPDYIPGMYSLSVPIETEKPFKIGDLIEVDINQRGNPFYSYGASPDRTTVISGTQICKVIYALGDHFRFEFKDKYGIIQTWGCHQPGHEDYVSGQYKLVSSDTKKKVSPIVYFFEKDCSVEYFAAESASYDLPFDSWVQEKMKEVKEGAAAYWRRTQPSWPWNKSLEISVNKTTGIFSAYWKDIPDDKLSMK